MYGLESGDSVFSYDGISLSTLWRAIEAHANAESRNSVRMKSVVSHSNFIEVLRSAGHRFNDSEIEIVEETDIYTVELERTIRRSDIEGGERTVSGSFACFPHEGSEVWTTVTGDEPDFFERGINWLLSKAAPQITEFFASSADLQTILDRLDSSIGGESEILATEVVSYTHDDEGNINYERKPYPVAFRKARSEDKYVDKVRFEAYQGEELLISGVVQRDGVTQFNGGNATIYSETFLNSYVQEGQEKAELFGDKERSRDTGEVQQIELTFEEPVFHEPQDNEKLINALSEVNKTNITVYHKNPYAHVSVLDIIDGSSSDVFITDSDKISIVPSYRSSLNSLMRLSDKISKEFDEGSITVNEAPEYDFADFFAG